MKNLVFAAAAAIAVATSANSAQLARWEFPALGVVANSGCTSECSGVSAAAANLVCGPFNTLLSNTQGALPGSLFYFYSWRTPAQVNFSATMSADVPAAEVVTLDYCSSEFGPTEMTLTFAGVTLDPIGLNRDQAWHSVEVALFTPVRGDWTLEIALNEPEYSLAYAGLDNVTVHSLIPEPPASFAVFGLLAAATILLRFRRV